MLAILSSSICVGVLAGVMNLVLMPLLKAHYGSSKEPSWIFALGQLSSLFLGPIIGSLSDRLGTRRPFLLVIALVGAAAIAGLTLPGALVSGIAAALVVACYYAFLTPYTAVVGDYSTPATRDRNFGFFMGTFNLAIFLCSLLLSAQLEGGLVRPLRILALLMIVGVMPTLIHTGRRPVRLSAPPKAAARSVFTFLRENRPAVIFYVMQFALWFGYGGLYPNLTTFLHEATDMPLGRASAWVGGSQLLCAVMAFATGPCCRLIGQRALFFVAMASLALLSGVMVFAYPVIVPGLWSSFFGPLAFLVFSAASGFLWSLIPSLLSDMVADYDQGRAFGINNMAMIGSQAIAVTVGGALIATSGFRLLFFEIFVGFAGALVMALVVFPLKRRPASQG